MRAAMRGDGARRTAFVGIGLALGCIAYYLTNPYWYGDAIYYAFDIGRGPSRIPLDSGHLLWRPLAYGLWRCLATAGLALDPLDALRLLSAAATALLCLATFVL